MAKSRVRKFLEQKINLLINTVMGSGVAQEENTASGDRFVTPGMPEKVRSLAEEGIVLLKNEGGILPLKKEETVSVFGRIQHDWFYVGYGSGGNVHAPYQVGFFEGLSKAGIRYNEALKKIYDEWTAIPKNTADHGYWGHWPYCQEEMPLDEATVREARKKSDVALIIIGRAAGEDRENYLGPGSYYLTDTEKQMLSLVTKAFEKTVLVMDCGNLIDLSFTDDYPIGAILYAWQLGQENANALANVLSGRVSPSGKLSDAVPVRYEDLPTSVNFGGKEYNEYTEDIYLGYRYFTTFAPERMRYPFGFGLSYTAFSLETLGVIPTEKGWDFEVLVTNTGAVSGKETVQIYVSAPDGALGKAKRSLAGYQKTGLLKPGASELLRIDVTEKDIASYDDEGVAGYPDAFVLEAGNYRFYLGCDCTADTVVYTWKNPETKCVEQCHRIMPLAKETAFRVLNPLGKEEITVAANGLIHPAKPVFAGQRDLKKRILGHLPEEIPPVQGKRILLSDVKEGRATLDDFIATLSDEDLANLTRGHGYLNYKGGTPGNTGAFGGITESLREKGIPVLITADGPAGLRIKNYATLLPCGTAIACTWNPALIEETFMMIGAEAKRFGVDVNLAPGLNLHRNPLGGRNFEYYSEDPMLSGRTAAAVVRGVQKGGTSACPKHFACNNQEYNRTYNDSRVSARALRELYLKNFEYCVKEGRPDNLMTSYNKVNGVWSHYNYDLATTVLREEWGYQGNVLTDWWMRLAAMPEFPEIKDNAYRVRAQVDVLMPGNKARLEQGFQFDKEQLSTLGKPDGLTRAELQRSAKNVLTFALKRL